MHPRLLVLTGAMLIAALPAPAAAQAVGTIGLARGETVNFQIDDGGAAVLARGRADALSAYDQATLDLVRNADPKLATGANAIAITDGQLGPSAPPIAPGAIRISFVAVRDGAESLLILENGYDRGLAYRARITIRGRSQPTDVCVVIPGRRGHEFWPEPIERIELSGFRLQPWDESQPVHCE
jgi:hypothetical protein